MEALACAYNTRQQADKLVQKSSSTRLRALMFIHTSCLMFQELGREVRMVALTLVVKVVEYVKC
jgi:hypothetical protein